MDEIQEAMARLGAPRPLPTDLRQRLAERLLSSEPMLEGLDDPRPLPPELRHRLLARLTPRRRSVPLWMNVAAAVILVAALSIIIVGGTGQGRTGTGRSLTALGPPRSEGATAPGTTTGGASRPGASSALGALGRSNSAAGPLAPSGGDTNAEPSGVEPGAAGPPPGPAPPFAFAAEPPAASFAASAPPAPAAAPALAPLAVGVVSGDPAEEQGFRAYVQLLDAGGGLRGRALNIVTVSSSAPARGVVATVNLSDAAVATASGSPAWVSGTPLLETLAVPEAALHGAVFDFSSAPDHQARLAVAEVFPSPSPGRTAVIFTERAGILSTEVPDAMAAALRAAQVTPLVVPYRQGTALPAADAAFLSLDTADARAWFADAARVSYHPPLGVTGIYSIAEPSLASSMPAGTQALAPYTIPDNAERAALADRIGTTPGMAAIHGWVTAKALAVALWQSGATTPAQTGSALAQLRGYDDDFAPPLDFRPGTTSRTPDAILMTVSGGSLVPSGEFRTDAG